MTALAIRLDQLTRDFATVRALDHLSLQVPAGVIFGFLGPNGAGKTTTINLLLGLLEPTDGRAEVLGFDTRTHANEVRLRTGALLEHSGLYEQMSAEENLEFYGRINRMPAPDRSARVNTTAGRPRPTRRSRCAGRQPSPRGGDPNGQILTEHHRQQPHLLRTTQSGR